jgi:ubiquinone/menaquinone biosynthesis C-methylase UbiE
MNTKDAEKQQGHWLLAKMGKRVLRPGGRELTQKLLNGLSVSERDNVVEFAPGMGKTASLLLENNPHSYTGIDIDPQAIENLKKQIKGRNVKFIQNKAAQTGLKDESADKVIGEAMLTMQANHRKSEIIKEAHRILKKGGFYGIHELGLYPDGLSENVKSKIQKELAQTIKVNARPLTLPEWKALLEAEGFIVRETFTNDMKLLEPGRILSDEGFFRALKIGFNVFSHPDAANRIFSMRKVFRKYKNHINAIAIIAEKI